MWLSCVADRFPHFPYTIPVERSGFHFDMATKTGQESGMAVGTVDVLMIGTGEHRMLLITS
jgi:hypothetical protein